MKPPAVRLPATPTLGAWRRAARRRLEEGGIDSPAVDADAIARHVLHLRAVDLTLQNTRVLMTPEKRRLSRFLHKRLSRIPLQYILGTVDFCGLTLRVSPAALIPRPETEGLVELVLGELSPENPGPVVDVGTGSGCIALSLASQRPLLEVWAVDISPTALRLARRNARELGLAGRVRFRGGDLTRPVHGLHGRLAAVVSNPPYVAPRDRRRLAPEVVDHEPETALFAPSGGLGIIRRLIPESRDLLAPGGLLALEIAEDQGGAVSRMLATRGGWTDVRVEADLAGRDRYVLARRI